jgi:hypothetical protein
MAKLYFKDINDEMCYELSHFMREAIDEGLDVLELFEAVEEPNTGLLFCKAVDSVAEEGSCGKLCEFYTPINGRNGKCIYRGKVYSHGEKVSFSVY